MEADEIREKLRVALASHPVKAAPLSRQMNRGPGYIAEFLSGKKETLGAAEASFLEAELNLPPGSLIPSKPLSNGFSQPNAIRPKGIEATDSPRSQELDEKLLESCVAATVETVFVALRGRLPTHDEMLSLAKQSRQLIAAQQVLERHYRQAGR